MFIGGFLYLQYASHRFLPSETKPDRLDRFLTETACGRLIRIPETSLSVGERQQLDDESEKFFVSAKTCQSFVRPITISSEELAFPLAFAILIHENIDQFDFLLRTIYRRSNYYCIHVDKKAPETLYQAVRERARCVTNIRLIERRIDVRWGDFSVLEAEHLCQKELLKQSRQWRYYFNLAGSDLPLKTNLEMVRILKLYNDQNDVTSLVYHSKDRQNRILAKKPLPPSISFPLYKGEFHVLLTRNAVEYIHTDARPMALFGFLNGTDVPDEHFYSMVNRWHQTPGYFPFDHDLSPGTFMTRYKIWADRPEARLCQGKFLRTICIFAHRDLWHLATAPHFFANKVRFDHDRLVPYCMGQYLDIRQAMVDDDRTFLMLNKSFYRQLSNVRYGEKKSQS